MSTSSTAAPQSVTPVAVSSRVLSIDIFRGLTMAVMIFVNALDGTRGLPWWTFHAHADWNAMTYVDMVFPFFLFIVGMSLPLSVAQRLKRNPSLPALWLHAVTRSLSLLVLGLILANAEFVDRSRTGVSGSVWALIGIVSAALYLNAYPKSQRFPAYAMILRVIGFIGVAVDFAVFRRDVDGHPAWIEFSYPEILGLIAFAYLAVSILYIPTRRLRLAAPIWFTLLILFNVACAAHIFGLPVRLPTYIWLFDNGAHAAIVMGGVVTSQIFLGLAPGTNCRPCAQRATRIALLFAMIAFLIGWLAIPLGISKIRATPTWSLWSVAAAVAAFTLLYWVCDQWRFTAWAFPVRTAGSNTLLTYLLPDLWIFTLGESNPLRFETHFNFGLAGVLKTVTFTLVMLALSHLLTRAKLRLQL